MHVGNHSSNQDSHFWSGGQPCGQGDRGLQSNSAAHRGDGESRGGRDCFELAPREPRGWQRHPGASFTHSPRELGEAPQNGASLVSWYAMWGQQWRTGLPRGVLPDFKLMSLGDTLTQRHDVPVLQSSVRILRDSNAPKRLRNGRCNVNVPSSNERPRGPGHAPPPAPWAQHHRHL